MLPIGLQLFSLREMAAKDMAAVLKTVAGIGYKEIQPAGFFTMRPSELKKMADDLGLMLRSSHSPCARNKGNLGECMEIATILGLKQIVCGGYGDADFADLDAIKRTAENSLEMKEILERNGFTPFQHNHNHEFGRLNSRIKYEIYRELCPGMKYELDCYWATGCGCEDPLKMLDLFAKDTILLHIKDGDCRWERYPVPGVVAYKRQANIVPIGQGKLPIREIFAHMPPTVEAVFVELDTCNIDMLEGVKQSYRFLTENGLLEGNK